MKRNTHSHLPYATLTDKGLVRDHNEDNLNITAFASVSELIPESLLCVLCDGVGGHQGGETASRLAVEQIISFIEACDASSPSAQLVSAILSANEQVWKNAQASPELHGMASTAACAWIIGKRLFTATVGDSRIYLIKNKRIQQISTDHTWLQEALDSGMIQPGDRKSHPNAHVIKRYIGSETPPEVDVRLKYGDNPLQNQQGMLLDANDLLFLCSDGISDLIEENEIQTIFKQQHNLETALETLKALAYQRGAKDNLSMIVVKIPVANPPVTRKQKWLRRVIFTILVLLASLVGIYLGWVALQ